MRNNIYLTGIICLVLILIAVLFKISHWPGAGILLITGIGSLSLIFLPITFFKLRKSTDDALLRFVYLAGFISFFIDFIGALFKVMHWPGAAIFMVIGIPLPFVFFLPVYLVYHSKRKLKADLRFFAVIGFMIYLGVFSTLLAIKPTDNVYSSLAFATNSLNSSNEFFINELNKDTLDEISLKNKELLEQIEQLKSLLIKHSNNTKSDFSSEYAFSQISNKSSEVPMILAQNESFIKFNTLFDEYINQINQNQNTARLIDEINNYRLPNNDNEYPLISHLPLIGALNILTDWQNKLLLIEYTM